MAVTANSTVYKAFKQRIFLLLLALQACLILATIAAVWQMHVPLEPPLLVAMATFIFLSTFTFIVVSHYVAKPVRDIEEFANNIVSSVVNDSLPNPPKLLKNNFVGPEMAAVMQSIYEVTEQSQQEKFKLSSTGVSMQSLFKDLPAGCIIFNEKAELSVINPMACKLLGISSSAPTTQEVLELIKVLQVNGSAINFVDWLHEARSNKIRAYKLWDSVILKQTNNDEAQTDVMFDLIASFHKRDVKSYELVLLLVDRTTEYQRQEKQMEFISLAAHELRGPITVMRGLVDVLSQEIGPTLSADNAELVSRISVSARQLASYVDNILSVSRVDRETFEVHLEKVAWPALLNAAVPELIERARTHKRKLTLSLPKSLPEVAVDPAAISHVINNLVDNAIKYSKEGGDILITAKVKDAAVETTVQDFGIGIPPNVVDNIFVKFYRSHRSKQSVGGTGLGLYLCKVVVESHGGNIWVRSTEGSGSTFGFSVPTYQSVAEQLKNSNNESNGIVRGSHGWIKNHALYRR